MAFCTGCGNEVADPAACPVCLAGRSAAAGRQRAATSMLCRCPRCNDALDQQDWDGIATLNCPNCRGTFFPTGALEQVLDKLRATVDVADAETVLQEFKDRHLRELPDAVRYKKCPVCEGIMVRRAYGTISGVIVDHCGDHGHWVDEAQFAALADFICRGGDVLANEIGKVRDRIQRRPDPGGGSVISKLFGG